MSERWTPAKIPEQTGRRAIVTGANSGIGFPAALELARHGAAVVIASRDQAKGEAAVARIRRAIAGAKVEFSELDLASLTSVRAFARREMERDAGLDLLINNAGVFAPAKRMETKDGFELQFGTNVLGHFALTGLLMPALERAGMERAASARGEGPRVVMIASIAHKRGAINFKDLQSRSAYSPTKAYQQSKLADLMLSFELDRRLRARGGRILSVAAHPGVANTNLFQVGNFGAAERAVRGAFGNAIGLLLNSDAEGALPTLFAATAPDVKSGGYYGPQGFQEMRGGDAGPANVARQARDVEAGERLWRICKDLTGVTIP